MFTLARFRVSVNIPVMSLAQAADEAPRRTRVKTYHKIPKISPGSYIFQRPFWEAYLFGGKFAFQNRLA